MGCGCQGGRQQAARQAERPRADGPSPTTVDAPRWYMVRCADGEQYFDAIEAAVAVAEQWKCSVQRVPKPPHLISAAG